MAPRTLGGEAGSNSAAFSADDAEAEILRPTARSPLTLVMSDQRDVVRALHHEVGLSDREIAEATGVSNVVTVRKWRSQAAKSEPRNRDQIDDLRAIVGLMLNSGSVDPPEVGRFLRSRNADLNYRRPLGVLARGGFERVRQAAELLLERLAGLDSAAAQVTGPASAPLGLAEGMERIAPSQSGHDPVRLHPMTIGAAANECGTGPDEPPTNDDGGSELEKPAGSRASSRRQPENDVQPSARRSVRDLAKKSHHARLHGAESGSGEDDASRGSSGRAGAASAPDKSSDRRRGDK